MDYNNTFNGRTKKKIIAINGNTVIEYIFETNKNKSVLCLWSSEDIKGLEYFSKDICS